MGESSASAIRAPKQAKQAVPEHVVGASEEQIIYANILNISMKLGLAGIISSFLLYVSGVVAPRIPVHEISRFWGMKSHEYMVQTNISGGWSWLGLYGYGDFLNFFPIAFLAGITIVCYLAIIPTLLRKKDTVYAVLAMVEVLVLVAAASGLISTGGH
ncbi:MAG: hypothetical protein QME41_09645 [Actinomycetota bacterium]|nr:hypothetical protein [Actinomycetota bacterium]